MKKLPRIKRIDDADVLRAFDDNEIPSPPRLKSKHEIVIGKFIKEKQVRESETRISCLANPIIGAVELQLPNNPRMKYTKEKLERFIGIIRHGIKISDASLAMGWDPNVLAKYVSENMYNLGTCVKAAQSEHKIFHVERISNHDYGHQSSAWLLERQYKEEFSKEVKITSNKTEEEQAIQFGDRIIKF